MASPSSSINHAPPTTSASDSPHYVDYHPLIDSFSYDFDTNEARGVSWQLRTNARHRRQRQHHHWCFDDPSTAALTWTCTVDAEDNLGTPGSPPTCGAL